MVIFILLSKIYFMNLKFLNVDHICQLLHIFYCHKLYLSHNHNLNLKITLVYIKQEMK